MTRTGWLRRIVLDFVHVQGPHTNLIAQDAVVNVLQTFGIVDKIKSVPIDNGSNKVKASNSLKDPEHEHLTYTLACTVPDAELASNWFFLSRFFSYRLATPPATLLSSVPPTVSLIPLRKLALRKNKLFTSS